MGPSICTFLCISGNNERHLDPVTGNLQWQQKPCDDGNVNSNGDGCTILCNVEKGWICTGGTATQPDTCTEICGDGNDYFSYPCDDGNLVDGDGCDSNCQIETGWTCDFGDFPFPDLCETTCVMTRSFDLGFLACVDENVNPDDG